MEFDSDAIRDAAARYDLLLVAVFGSRAKGNAREASDVDVAVLARHVPEEKADWLGGLEADLSAAFRGFEIDVALLNEASPLLMFEVARTGRAIFGEAGAFSAFRSLAARMYYDNERRMNRQAEYLARLRPQ